jgi:hypothetical protein
MWTGWDRTSSRKRISRSGGPRHERVEMAGKELVVLTASTPELQRFLLDAVASA